MTTETLPRGIASDTYDSSVLFTPGEAGPAVSNPYAWLQLTTVGASATTAVGGSGGQSDQLTLADASLVTVGGYYQIGSADPVRIDWRADDGSNIVGLHLTRSWSNGAQVKPVTVATASVAGMSYNTSTGARTGTPSSNGTTTGLFYRFLDAAGVSIDKPETPYDLVIEDPPVPPVFIGLVNGQINSEAFQLNQDVTLNWGAAFTGASSFSLTGTKPHNLTFNTTTGVLSGLLVELGSFGPFTVTATNGAGSTDSNQISLTVSLPDPIWGVATRPVVRVAIL